MVRAVGGVHGAIDLGQAVLDLFQVFVIGKRVWSAKLPFGPYLAFGAMIWMFFGEPLIRWYSGLLTP
jgi:prepilin signal peptidase PulO-like enzyme (type II secretory pathway)